MTDNRGRSARAHVCSALDAEWRRVATSSAGRAATLRWAEVEPALAGACSGHDVVRVASVMVTAGEPSLWGQCCAWPSTTSSLDRQ